MKNEFTEVLKGMNLEELLFLADDLSDSRINWSYDKRSKSSVRQAVLLNAKPKEIQETLRKCLAQELPSGSLFPTIIQAEKTIFGPLGLMEAIQSRKRDELEPLLLIFERFIKGNNLISKYSGSNRISNTELKSFTKEFPKATIAQFILAKFKDEEIHLKTNELLQKQEINIEITGLFEDVGYPWIVTRYGLSLNDFDSEPIVALANLIKNNYSEEELLPELRSYPGDFDSRLLEYCIMENPDIILKKLFGLPKLRNIASKMNFASTNISEINEAVSIVMIGLCFDVPPSLIGISSYRTIVVHNKRDFLESKELETKSAIMLKTFVVLERVLRDLCSFYVNVLWKSKIEDLEFDAEFEKPRIEPSKVKVKALDALIRKKFSINKPLERFGFGDYINLIRLMNQKASKSEFLTKKLMKKTDRKMILEKTELSILDRISPYRACFAHAKDYPKDHECEEILEAINSFLNIIAERKIFPLVIKISKEIHDVFGKSYAESIDENNETWLIYSDEFLIPSQPYFLFSRTSGIAVNPVLVPKIF
jgi:hypothetical protein